MRLVIQRVTRAAVAWQDTAQNVQRRESIERGLAILLGAGASDSEADVKKLAEKVGNLRVFADEAGRSNRSLLEVGGEALVVSQFTLYADLRRGRRPSFIAAGDPAQAARRYQFFVDSLRAAGVDTKTGQFGAAMTVSLDNDGPVTIVMSTDAWDTRT